jgi:hypothetical protein
LATIVPYFVVPFQALGVVAAGFVLSLLVPRLRLGVLVAAAATLLLVIVLVQQLWSDIINFDASRARLASAPGIGEREQCLVDGGTADQVAFVRWLAVKVPPDAKLGYVGSFDAPCLQLALLPRRLTADRANARYVMYLDPRDERSRRLLSDPPAGRDIEVFAPSRGLEVKD